MPIRAKVVTAAQLSKSIDKAVALTAKKYDVSFKGGTTLRNWEILGRILREMPLAGGRPLDVAESIMKGAGLKGTPVVARIGRDILVGVIPIDMNVGFR